MVMLTWAADAFRQAGLRVIEQNGWKTRTKSSGGYKDGRPWGCMWHHTAGTGSTAAEANYMSFGAAARPIANVCIGREGEVWVLAAGPTNTNGVGNATRWSKGLVPNNSMNSYAWGIELNNDGRGQMYPQAQVDAAFVVSNVINARCGNQPTDVCTHTQWAPSRKTDPAAAVSVQGSWKPRSCNSSGSWNLDDLKAECQRRAQPTSTPSPGGQEVSEVFAIARPRGYWDTGIIGPVPEGQSRHLTDPAKAQLLVDSFLVMDLQGKIVPAGTNYNSVTRVIEDVGLFTTLTGITPGTQTDPPGQ